MPRLMQQKNGQYLVTVPRHVVQVLQASRGDPISFEIDLKKQKVWVEKKSS